MTQKKYYQYIMNLLFFLHQILIQVWQFILENTLYCDVYINLYTLLYGRNSYWSFISPGRIYLHFTSHQPSNIQILYFFFKINISTHLACIFTIDSIDNSIPIRQFSKSIIRIHECPQPKLKNRNIWNFKLFSLKIFRT